MLLPAQHVPPLIQQWVDYHLPAYPSITGTAHAITARTIGSFLSAVGWVVVLLISFIGWGRLIGKLAGARLPTSVASSLGIASLIFLGGILNQAHAIYPSTLLLLTCTGLLAYFSLLKSRPEDYSWITFWRKSSAAPRALLILALVILLCRVAATVRLGSFNITDDSSAYLVFPQKMLAAHRFAFDPFSERRLLSSLGGAYFLQAFVLLGTSVGHIAMADRTIGLILLAPALFDLGIAFGLLPFQISLLGLLAFIVPQETFNLTFIILPITLFLSMMWFLLETRDETASLRLKYMLMLGAVGGAAIGLKSTYLPTVAAISVVPCVVAYCRQKWKRALLLPFMAAVGIGIVLISWMVSMKMSSGTYLFPVLGSGLDYSAYIHLYPVHPFTGARSLAKLLLQGIVLAALAAILLRTGKSGRNLLLSSGYMAASSFAIIAFNYKSGGDYIWRYNFPQFFSAIIVFYAAASSSISIQPDSKRSRAGYYLGIICLIAMVFYYDASGKHPQAFRQFNIEGTEYRHALYAGLANRRMESARVRNEYKLVQQSLPGTGASLENVAYPFLFDYKKNHIFVMDWPGAASPKPGWPYGVPSTRLASYLKDNSINYVIYDYAFASWNDAKNCQNLNTPELFSNELDELMRLSVIADGELDALKARYNSIYNDGMIAVIDLDKPVKQAGGPARDRQFIADERVLCKDSLDKVRTGKVFSVPHP